MATYAIRPFGEAVSTNRTKYFTPELASAAEFKVGAVLVMTAGGSTEAGTNPSAIFGVATAASDSYDWMEDSHGYVNPRVPVARPDEEFRGTLVGTFAASDVGADYGITEGVDGIWYVDKAKDGASARVTVTGHDDIAVSLDGEIATIADGDTNVPVTFVFIPEFRRAG